MSKKMEDWEIEDMKNQAFYENFVRGKESKSDKDGCGLLVLLAISTPVLLKIITSVM